MPKPEAQRFDALSAWLDAQRPYARLALDSASGTIEHTVERLFPIPGRPEDPTREAIGCEGRLLLPPEGGCLVLLRSAADDFLARNFAGPLRMTGGIGQEAWAIDAPQVYARVVSDPGERPAWALVAPVLFRECFDEHVRMQRSSLPWRKLSSYCGAIEDGGFLEQKFSSLMMAVEFFIRTSLLEAAPADRSKIEGLTLPDLIGWARKRLKWDIPKHYLKDDLVRLLRNAVVHGGELPTRDSQHFRSVFDKWHLFLFRRVLIRLGYTGRVASPERGWAFESPVDDFSEEHNSF